MKHPKNLEMTDRNREGMHFDTILAEQLWISKSTDRKYRQKTTGQVDEKVQVVKQMNKKWTLRV